MAEKIKIMLTGGGTAGHLNPLLAVSSAIRKIGNEKNISIRLSYIGCPGRYYAKKFKESRIPVKKIFSSKIRRYASLKNIWEIPKFIIGIAQSLWYVFREMPDIVVSKGGPGSLAPVIAARFYSIPVAIHESDAVPSRTTKFSAKFAKKIFLSFKEAETGLSPSERERCEVVGNPLREFLTKDFPNKAEAKKKLGFNPEKPLLLILGGSQGARRINNLVTASLPELLGFGIQILHQTGTKLFGQVSGDVSRYFGTPEKMRNSGYRMADFFDTDIKDAMSAADLIISRSGSAIFEFAAFGKPSLLIPLAEAAQNHQLKNARAYERYGGCIVVEERTVSVPFFVETVRRVISDPELLKKMSDGALSFAKPEAASIMARKLVKLANG